MALTLVVTLVTLLAAPSCANDPFGTPAPPPTPAPATTCIVTSTAPWLFIDPGATKVVIESEKVCASYTCQGGAAPRVPTDCGAQCVSDTSDDSGVNQCICAACSNGAPGGQTSNPCEPTSPCVNGGVCSAGATAGTYTCTCPAPYHGANCDLSLCAPSPCQNGATCVGDASRTPSYRCDCAPGYSDNQCQTAKCDESTPPCQHGNCSMNPSAPRGFYCHCQADYYGQDCDTHCVDNNAGCGDWSTAGYCQDATYGGWMSSNCRLSCKICSTCPNLASNPCKNSGTCKSSASVTGYACTCTPGYSGDTCTECLDLQAHTANCPGWKASGYCNATSQYAGWMATNCGKSCEKDCSVYKLEGCQNGATCVGDASRTPSYRCDCAPGYSDNQCQTAKCDESTPPCQHGNCSMNPGAPRGFYCHCQADYYGQDCDTHCVDNNAGCGDWSTAGYCQDATYGGWMSSNCRLSCKICSTCPNLASNPCKNSGTCKSSASVTGYACTCTPGYSGDTCTECIDLQAHTANCPGWKASGYCNATSQFAGWMATNCGKSCEKDCSA